MAMPPTAADAPADSGAPPPDMMGSGAAPEDTGGEDEVIATICRTSDGKFKLYAGDEPEEGGDMPAGAPGEAPGAEPAAPEGQTFDSPGELMRALMPILDAGGADAAESSFGKAFRGEPDSPAAEPAAPMAG